jgi:hypothetical protein
MERGIRSFAPRGRGPAARALLTLLLAAAGSLAAAGVAQAAGTGTCRAEQVPVSVPGVPGSYEIAGTLCTPPGTAPTTVQVLVPGATYDATYWNFPVPGYSYQQYAAAHGQATFALDRLNTAGSSRLPSLLVTVQADANVLHQVIGDLASGQISGVAYTHVVTVGHSLGSIIVADEAAAWHDESAVVLTGFTHYLDPLFVTALGTGQVLVPAALASPRLASQPLGDLSTPPGARATWFYNTSDASPAVIAKDQATESVITAGELATFPIPMVLPETSDIGVPVLQAVGQDDAVFWCGLLSSCTSSAALRTAEAPFFGGSPSYTAYVLPRSGHDLDLAANHQQFYDVLSHWVSAHASPAKERP